mgnify:CR=1 FL=1
MYSKEDRNVANDRFRAVMNQLQKLDREKEFKSACLGATEKYRNEVTKLRIQMAELQTKVDLYEKYISYCTDHDSVELGEVCSFNGELYRMVSREDKQDTDSPKTVCCEFICVTPITLELRKKLE